MVLSITIGHPLFAHNNLPKFAKMAKIRQSPGFFLRYLAENVTKKHWFIQIFNQSQYSTCWSFPIGGQISSTKYHFSQHVTEMNFTLRKTATQIISWNTFKMVV